MEIIYNNKPIKNVKYTVINSSFCHAVNIKDNNKPIGYE